MITKAERTELRGVVRNQFRVLRAEMIQRQAELLADVEVEVAERFADEDAQWDVVQHKIGEAVREACS